MCHLCLACDLSRYYELEERNSECYEEHASSMKETLNVAFSLLWKKIMSKF